MTIRDWNRYSSPPFFSLVLGATAWISILRLLQGFLFLKDNVCEVSSLKTRVKTINTGSTRSRKETSGSRSCSLGFNLCFGDLPANHSFVVPAIKQNTERMERERQVPEIKCKRRGGCKYKISVASA